MSSAGDYGSNGILDTLPAQLLRSMSNRDFIPSPQKPMTYIEDEVFSSAKRENPLIKQFSQNYDVSSFNPITKQSSSTSSQPSQESLYEKVVHNRPLTSQFLEDSSTDSAEEDGDSDEEERVFKFNSDHCLYVFNALKYGYGQQSGNANNAYVNLSHQHKAEYLRHLELIDLQLDLPKLTGLDGAQSKRKKKRSETLLSNDSSETRPPQTLREIFKISNTNRKKNKQRKKSKLEYYANQTGDTIDTASSASSSAAPPPTTVH